MTRLASDTVQRAHRHRLVDGCGRPIDHLRLSVTSKCELRCVYCRPARDACLQEHSGQLTDDQRLEFVEFLHHRFGLAQVRITGGEPLLYPGVVSLVARLKRAVPDVQLAMTTNGRRLYQKGFELYHAGLDRLNVSLDSLDPARYRRITGASIGPVLDGIESACFVGFPPPKINTVVLRGFNEDEIADLAIRAWSWDSEIRFLEAMPIGPAAEANRRAFVSGAQIEAKLAERFDLEPIPGETGETARRFRASSDSNRGIIGLITPVTEPFCAGCRRMRLTASGRLYPCLLDDRSTDIRAAWSGGGFCAQEAARLIRTAVMGKQARGSTQLSPMIMIGG